MEVVFLVCLVAVTLCNVYTTAGELSAMEMSGKYPMYVLLTIAIVYALVAGLTVGLGFVLVN